ncbi:extracellular solute-binding protein [Rhizobium sp. S96]|uniref:ABC transporter substrate-binding protein n=1 Tax=Rhizobium sp. S96 TaxID=3055140 RepID=UPI0025AA99C5|nr:extracellular solute-binding protein [Rhizobium sp. S96]MDM9623971.1 extracellular solute-binding protein [Rhizobium sp. S96]
MRKFLLTGISAAALAMSMSSAFAETIRIAEHRQARIDALKAVAPAIEKKYGVEIEIVEYPAPEKDYLSKLLTELRAGNAPDLFTAPASQDVADMVAAGYLAPITDELKAWDGYGQLFDVSKKLVARADGDMYVLPAMLKVQQLYYRKDILEKAGISTAQPKTWAELMDRAKEIKAKTGNYGLMFPAGVTWGGGSFQEGFQYLILGTSTPQIANDDETLNLKNEGVKDAFGFYADLINNDLMPVQPLLGPEPWVIPKYQMFPAGKLVATTCGSWCYIYDWGVESKNPIPDVTNAVGTWAMPGKDGGEHVVVDLESPWGVNAKASDPELAKKVLLEIGSVAADVAYAKGIGNIPARKDATSDPEFQKLTALVPILGAVENGTFLKTAPGFSALQEGIARATEALLRKETDAAGAQKILVDYVSETLGDDMVK